MRAAKAGLMDAMPSFIKAAVSLFAVVNPLGAVPVFMGVVAHRSPRERARIASIAGCVVLLTLLGSALAGEAVLRFLGVSVASFRVAGGLLLLLMGISMLHASPSPARNTPEELDEAGRTEEATGVAVVPIGLPLLAGPGSISTVVLYSQQCDSTVDHAVLVAAIGAVALAVWLHLLLAAKIGARVSATGIKVGTRLMGLVISALAVEFMVEGLAALLPGLAGPLH